MNQPYAKGRLNGPIVLTVASNVLGLVFGATGHWRDGYMKFGFIPIIVCSLSYLVFEYLNRAPESRAKSIKAAMAVAVILGGSVVATYLLFPKRIFSVRLVSCASSPPGDHMPVYWQNEEHGITTVYETTAWALIQVTNETDVAETITGYAIESKFRFWDWRPLHSIDYTDGKVMFGDDMTKSIWIELVKPAFNLEIEKTIPPHETIEGMVLLSGRIGWSPPLLRIRIRDFKDETVEDMPLLHYDSNGRLDVDRQLLGMRVRQKNVDLTGFRLATNEP